jgi:electron transfer flavoprotein alpha subunit
MSIAIDNDLCNGCKRCIKTCPYGALEMKDDKAQLLDRCTACGACVDGCPQGAIQSDTEPKVIPDFSDRQGVWVFAEQEGGKMHKVSLELLGKARALADQLGQDVSALLLGSQVSSLSKDLINYGADCVYQVQHKALTPYRTLAYAKVLEELVRKHKPNIFLIGATPLGRDLAPRVARSVEAGLTADCTELSIDPEEGLLLQTRPAFGGNVMATIVNRYSRPQMATIRQGIMETAKKGIRKGTVRKHKVSLLEKDIHAKVLEVIKEKRHHVDLSQTKIIVAGGRGVGSKKGFTVLEKLADLMKGEIAGTRVAVEEGWIPPEYQVGQTGQSVRPEIYIACGISGAIQHRAGMMNSRYVIAINKDPLAPIFQIADWGLVGDFQEIVSEMISHLKRESH